MLNTCFLKNCIKNHNTQMFCLLTFLTIIYCSCKMIFKKWVIICPNQHDPFPCRKLFHRNSQRVDIPAQEFDCSLHFDCMTRVCMIFAVLGTKFYPCFPQYHLGGKNLPVRFMAYLRLESTEHKKIGETIKALQICKRLTQTASL